MRASADADRSSTTATSTGHDPTAPTEHGNPATSTGHDSTTAPTTHQPLVPSRAHALSTALLAAPADLIANPATAHWELHAESGPVGALSMRPHPLTVQELPTRRHLAGYVALEVSGLRRAAWAEALRGPLHLRAHAPDGTLATTGVQIPGVLDDLYADAARAGHGPGPHVHEQGVELSLWAPTARRVTLLLGDHTADGPETELPADWDERSGLWRAHGGNDWVGRTYRWRLEVYAPSVGHVVTNTVTDPYATALTVDSQRAVVADLADSRWAPTIWTNTPAPRLDHPARQTIWELHVRDFSAADPDLPERLRGMYTAVGHPQARGTAHLRRLAEAGVTTVHLQPTFDFATVPELRSRQRRAQIPTGAGPASTAQQAAIAHVADEDEFNWGYDPWHWLAPEGSYATDGAQDGPARSREFRQMVGQLHAMGLQVVLDVVFNHTAFDGQHERSLLDRVVPGYYHRLDAEGRMEASTCTSNVATEHAMAEHLMIRALVLWAREYRVDGFRFDLMGHHTRENLLTARAALDALTLEADGVDGAGIYLYGEGWNFGEVMDGARFDQAIQGMLDGTSIGTFSDRLRDGVHGGGPADADKRLQQGFGTGLALAPNGGTTGMAANAADADELRRLTDWVRIGMGGSLRHLRLLCADGVERSAEEVDYNGMVAGYASRPEEAVSYVDAHDNETLYDIGVWKLPVDTPLEERVRAHVVMLATVLLGQSPAFFCAGAELLRSKSLDTDSYNSGDHFNAVDWTGASSRFGVGLPPADRNEAQWPLMVPRLDNPALRPDHAAMVACRDRVCDLLRVRASTPLLTLGDPAAILAKLSFPNAGPSATPGLLVMRIDDTIGDIVDPEHAQALVVLNAGPAPLTERIEDCAGISFALHPVLADGADPRQREVQWDANAGLLSIPGRTAAVLLARRG